MPETPAAPSRTLRTTLGWLLVIGFILVALVCIAWPRGPAPSQNWITLLAATVAYAALAACSLGNSDKTRRGHVTADRSGSAFVIGPWRLTMGRLLAACLASLALMIRLLAELSQPSNAAATAVLGTTIATVVGVSLLLVSNRPNIRMLADSLQLQRVFGHYDIPWDAITPLPPPDPDDSGARKTSILRIGRPDLVTGTGWVASRPETIKLPHLVVLPYADLAELIDYYVTRPASRQAIGTPLEYQQLLATALV
jgi:hypothetical protein